ncbi:MAG TPA: M20/M25/M40 family metallo-hydrolase, partial [Mariniphaga sp.]|nr:M20/M25/M40 family metallo-hydrolase [Mariniphaga sp.]
MLFSNVIEFTRLLISLDTVNPPGNEAVAAELTGTLLKENGFKLTNIPYGSNRHHLVAEKGCDSGKPILIFTGHFDTVPLGAKEWTVDPFGGETIDGKIYGRGSSDMKGGVAAMVGAAINAFAETEPQCGVKLLFTADEETGCKGAGHLVQQLSLQEEVIGIVVGEPTANVPVIGQKGGLYLKVTTSGKTAHSSMPHLGDNAIYKAAKAILKAEQFEFNVVEDDLLGFSTINVGRMQGGLNLNSVPDYA